MNKESQHQETEVSVDNDKQNKTDIAAAEGKSPDMKEAKGKKGQLKLTSLNESASKRKRPFDYAVDSDKLDSPKKEREPFALKDLDPDQMLEINQLL